ncbi:MAG: hypothetical protein RL759_1137 [Verrucomicrobiota bacterium]
MAENSQRSFEPLYPVFDNRYTEWVFYITDKQLGRAYVAELHPTGGARDASTRPPRGAASDLTLGAERRAQVVPKARRTPRSGMKRPDRPISNRPEGRFAL